MEKEESNIKLVFIDNFIYADHSYKFLPEFKPNAIDGKIINQPISKLDKFEEWNVPVRDTINKNSLDKIGHEKPLNSQ
jgi:hypothetical protein